MNSKKIVVTGAPGTGKTVLVEALEHKGFKCYHEIIRTMTASARKEGTRKEQVSNPLLFVDDPFEFNKFLLESRLNHLHDSNTIDEPFCFFDRGTPDVLAYMNYFEQQYGEEFEEICSSHRYTSIFILPPWKEIYKRDNERLETFEQAEELHHHLLDTYKKFDYDPIIVPPDSIDNRLNFVISSVSAQT